MKVYTYELEEEFETIAEFIEKKYKICIKSKEQLVNFTKHALLFMMSLKIWKKHLVLYFKNLSKIEMYFEEMLSNIIHIIILGNIDMKMPALIMLRRTQEIILTYLYYAEHPVEYYKKESDDRTRPINGFNELKDYIKNYPYSMKYKISDQEMQEFVSEIIDQWGMQYRELSNYVHGTNSNFFQNTQYIDEFKFEKKDVNFLTKQIEMLSSIVNSLLIVFYFEDYIKFEEYAEKTLIRNAISNKFDYKKKIVSILKEI